MKILVTGANGFVGKNLLVRLAERQDAYVSRFVRGDTDEALLVMLSSADIVVHLAGENRPISNQDFDTGNRLLTQKICDGLSKLGRKIPLILASSTQAELNNPYGESKREAEISVINLAEKYQNPVGIYRLPGVFGKWCKPNYNSVVATFCHNISRNIPIEINSPEKNLELVYIDDVIASFIDSIFGHTPDGVSNYVVSPQYSCSLKELAIQIGEFQNSRATLVTEKVGTGFARALYATYISYLPMEKFQYKVVCHSDDRGAFVEMLKTKDSGQFSYFTAHPGITRGGHYHHTKSEKFLVVKGTAEFRFRCIVSGDNYAIKTSCAEPTIVETIPGWAHDITNIGEDEMIVMLWANEIFDRDKPDTVASKV
jgi:UDP-2-acetamido-2,6-beta-L-arabino-hexul-4-ose reductase